MLLVVQIVAVASGALPVYWLARKHLDSAGAAAGFAAVYLLYPATQYNALSYSGPHAVSFAVPLILFAVWFLDNDRLVPFAVTALLAAATKEEIGLAVGCLGIWYAVAHGRRLVGATIFAPRAGGHARGLLPRHPPLRAAGRRAVPAAVRGSRRDAGWDRAHAPDPSRDDRGRGHVLLEARFPRPAPPAPCSASGCSSRCCCSARCRTSASTSSPRSPSRR